MNRTALVLAALAIVNPASSFAQELSFFVADPVRDGGQIDLTGLSFRFNRTTGDYTIVVTAADANPFSGSFRLNVNLFNPDIAGAANFFQDNVRDFALTTAVTSITLTGTNAVLRSWNAGHRVATNSNPFGNPAGSTLFRTGLALVPSPDFIDETATGFAVIRAPCIPFPSGLVPFSSVNYVSRPNASGERLLVGSLGASASEINQRLTAIQSIPLPAFPGQQFCGLTPLAPGVLVEAYVPTTAERSGDFNGGGFAALLLDPLTNAPFPSGTIPANRLGGVYAWRFAITNPASLPGLILSQTGFTFRAAAGGPQSPPFNLRVLSGSTAFDYTLAASTLSGGNWLDAAPLSGNTNVATPVAVRVDPSRLAPGEYYGQIEVRSNAAGNSPQIVTVVLIVTATGAASVDVTPTGLVFTTAPTANPPAQQLSVANPTARAVNFNAALSFPTAARPFAVQPAAGAINPGQSAAVTVSVAAGTLVAGTYPATLTLQFSDGTARTIPLLLVIAPGATSQSARAADACNPARLLPVSTLLPSNFSATVAWPSPLEVIVVDDCGAPRSTGAVVASFSNGDPPLVLVSNRNGRWSGTWTPRNARSANLQVTVDAQDGALQGSVETGGGAGANPEVPLLNGGLLGAASYGTLPAPGAIVSLFGTRLADGLASASSLPLPIELMNGAIFLGGKPLPLIFTSTGQVNAVIPFSLAAGQRHQLVVRRGTRQSVPESIALRAVQPAVFTTDLSGKGQGHIYRATAAGEQILAAPETPVRMGDVLVVYCAGLGPVDPGVDAGIATPLSPLTRTVNSVTATIGGVDARVTFAGLTPGFTGLYQVNLEVPPGVEAGDTVAVVLNVVGVESIPVTIAVR